MLALGGSVDASSGRGIADVGAWVIADDRGTALDMRADIDRGLGGQGARCECVVTCPKGFAVAERLLDLRGELAERPVRSLEQLIVGRDDVLDLVGCLRLHQWNEIDQHGGVGQALAGAIETRQGSARRHCRLQYFGGLHGAPRWERRQVLVGAIRVFPHGRSVRRPLQMCRKMCEISTDQWDVSTWCTDGSLCYTRISPWCPCCGQSRAHELRAQSPVRRHGLRWELPRRISC